MMLSDPKPTKLTIKMLAKISDIGASIVTYIILGALAD